MNEAIAVLIVLSAISNVLLIALLFSRVRETPKPIEVAPSRALEEKLADHLCQSESRQCDLVRDMADRLMAYTDEGRERLKTAAELAALQAEIAAANERRSTHQHNGTVAATVKEDGSPAQRWRDSEPPGGM